MQIDFFTIFFSIFIVDISIVFVMLYYIVTVKNHKWFIYTYLVQRIIEAVALIAIGLRNEIPDFISIEIANTLFFITAYIQVISIASFKGTLNKKFATIALFITAFFNTFYILNSCNAEHRVIIQSLGSFVIFSYAVYELFRIRKPYKMPMVIAMGYAMYAIANLMRAANLFFNDFVNYNPTEVNNYDLISNIIGIYVVINTSVGFFILINEISEKTIIENNHLINTALEQSPVSIVITDLERRIKYVNPQFEKRTGYTKEEAYGLKPDVLKSGLTEKNYYTELNKKLKTGDVWQGEFINKAKNGELYYEQAVIAAIKDQNGEPKNYIAFKIDISDKKYLETKVKESEAKYQLLAENLTDVIWTFDIENVGFNYISPSITPLLGFSTEEASEHFFNLKQNQNNIFISLINEIIQEIKNTSNNSNTIINKQFEYQQLTKDGILIWVETDMRVVDDFEKKNHFILGITRNIDHRKHIENQLLQSTEDLKEAQKVGNVGHWDYDLMNDMVRWSEQTYRIYEEEPTEFFLSFENVTLLYHPEDRQLVIDEFYNALNYKTNFEITHRIITKTGKIKYLTQRATTKYNQEGMPVRALGSVQDVTKLKENENLLKELNATKDKFFSIIAHDLKNPFNTLLGFSDLLLKNHNKYEAEKRRSFIQNINTITINTLQLLENLLTWARSQSGRIQINIENVNLRLLADNIVSLLVQTAMNKKITLTNLIAEDIFVSADKNMLETIIRNLITNALKFTPEDGKVTLEVQTEEKFAIVSITDNGIGMSETVKNSLFKLGKTKSATGTKGENGTGLGLILCKEFVENNNGNIHVESELGKGSKFIFSIPLSV